MKKTSFTAKALLAALAIAAVGCDKATTSAPESPKETATAESAVGGISTNIRYIDVDSILSAYTLAQEILQQNQKDMVQYQQRERQKQAELERLGAEIQRKAQTNVYLSEASYKADVDAFNKKQEAAARELGAQQNKIQADVAARQARLTDSISSYVRDYNASRGYDAILLRESGVYFKPELNITAEIIEGLNARYTPAATTK